MSISDPPIASLWVAALRARGGVVSALSRNHLLALAAIGLALFVVAIGFAAAKAEVSPTVLVVSALVAAAAGGAVIAAILRGPGRS